MVSQTNLANDFNSTTSVATRSFLNRSLSSEGFNYSLFNPSIADYVLAEYINSIDDLILIFRSLDSVRSLESIVSFEKEGIISSDNLLRLKIAVFDDALVNGKSYDYLIVIASLLKEDASQKDRIVAIINNIIFTPLEIKELAKFLNLIILFKDDVDIKSYEFLFNVLGEKLLLDELEIESLSSFVEKFRFEEEFLLSRISKYFNYYITFELNSEIAALDPSDYHEGVFDEYGNVMDAEVNEGKLQDKIIELGYSLADKFSPSIIKSLGVNIDDIVEGIDIEEVISDFYDGDHGQDWADDEHSSLGGRTVLDDPIDDLFERT